MTFYATTTATIFRTTIPMRDAFGDPVDVDVQIGTAVSFSLVERSRKVWDPASGILRTIRYFAGRCYSNVDIRKGDRVLDNADGRKYVVDELVTPTRGLAGHASTSLELIRQGGA